MDIRVLDCIDIPEKASVIELNLGDFGFGYILCGFDVLGKGCISWFERAIVGEKNPSIGKHYFLTWEKIEQSYFVYYHSSSDKKAIFQGQGRVQVSMQEVLSKRLGLAYYAIHSTYRMQGTDSRNYKIVIPFDVLHDALVNCLRRRRNLTIVDSLDSFNQFVGYYPFYRGHSDCTYRLLPSLFRGHYQKHEMEMFQEFLETRQKEMKGKTDYEILSLMQHYGLPTRLLDITTDKYVALFMACSTVFGQLSDINKIGAVLCFPNPNVIDAESEVVKRITHIARDGNIPEQYSEAVEHPFFIRYKDHENNPRQNAQKGSFILFGTKSNPDVQCKIILVVNKQSILDDLSRKGYNEKTLLPELEHFCHFIKQKYSI